MVLRSVLVALACVVVPAVDARAQECPSWRTGFGDPTLSGPAYASIVYPRAGSPLLFVGGAFNQAGHVFGARCAAWGPTYGWTETGNFNGAVRAFAIYDSGAGPQIYAGGDFTSGSQLPNGRHVVRGNGFGFIPVGTGVDGPVHALAVFDDGTGPALYAGGLFANASGVPAQNVARWNGTSWSAVGSGTNGLVRALVVFDDGTGHALYAGGDFLQAGGVDAQRVARWNGTSWSACGSGVDGSVRVLKSHRVAGHEIMAAGGDFTHAGGAPASRVAHWDGAAWSAFGAGFDGPVHVMIKHDAGAGDVLYAGGGFGASGSTATGPVARWDGAAWVAAGEEIAGSVSTLASYASGPTQPERLFAAGDFGLGSSPPGSLNIAVREDDAWRAPGQGIDGEISELLVHDDGSGPALYAGGHFPNAGGTRANHIARWDGEGWTALGSGVSGGTGFSWTSVAALHTHDDGSGAALYAGGDFDTAGGVAALGIARWDGASWSAVGGGVDGAVYALATFDDGTGPALYAAGAFDTAGGVPCSNVARWNGTSWTSVGAGFNWWAGGLAAFDDGTGPALYACGIGVERWNGSTWSPVGSPGDSQENIAVIDDGTGPALYVSGADGLQRWNGSTWVVLYSDAVVAMGAFDDGTGNGTALYMSTWDRILKRVDNTWAFAGYVNFPNGSSIPGHDMAVFDDGFGPGPNLFVGGRWGLIGPTATPVTVMSGIAALNGCGGAGRLFCFGDGTSTACPCGNASAPGARVGCLSSLGMGGAVRARGVASIADDTLVLDGTQMSNSSALFVQGATLVNGGAGVTFGDGIKCTGGPFVRLATKTNVGGASSYPVAGDVPLAVRGHVTTPGLRRYQVRYRNSAPFCTPDTFNYTNGVEILWSL